MARKLRKVALLGAFEIQSEGEPSTPVRDGLILGSRREQRGFVLETSRDSIEQIAAAAGPPRPGLPRRLIGSLGTSLQLLGYTLVRVELLPMPDAPLPPPPPPQAEEAEAEEDDDEIPFGSYVQGFLVFKQEDRKFHRLPMTATESIQVSLIENLPLMADDALLSLNVSGFLEELDAFAAQQAQEERTFRRFVDNVTASDFTRFYQEHPEGWNEGDDA